MPFNFLRRRRGPGAGLTRSPDGPAAAGFRTPPDGRAVTPITLPAAGRGRAGTGSETAEPGEAGAADPIVGAAAASPVAVEGGAAAVGGGTTAASGTGMAAGAMAAVGASPGSASVSGALRFDGLTEEWRLVGQMAVDGRLSDALNRRQPIGISDVSWAPADGTEGFSPVPAIRTIDPYDLIAVLAGPDTLPVFTKAERAARRVRKERYEVALEVPPFRIVGVVHLRPGEAPERLIEQGTELFLPLTDAVAYLNGRPVADPDVKVVLVNRLYIRGVEQIGR